MSSRIPQAQDKESYFKISQIKRHIMSKDIKWKILKTYIKYY